HASVECIVSLNSVGSKTFFLRSIDETLNIPRGEFFVINIGCLQQALDGGKLVLSVEDLKGLRKGCITMMRAQQAIAQTVKCAHPHSPRIDWENAGESREQLTGGLVREGNSHHAAGAHLAGLHQPGNSSGQNTCLAASGTSQY